MIDGSTPLDNARHEVFAQNLARGMSATEAYAKAGYKPSDQHASRLARNGKVRARVAFLQGQAAVQVVQDIVTRAGQFDVLATESLAKAIEGLAELDTSALRATDIRSLAETAERAARMFELLEGRATNRSDDMTRSKLDDLMNEMRDELEQSLDDAKTVH